MFHYIVLIHRPLCWLNINFINWQVVQLFRQTNEFSRNTLHIRSKLFGQEWRDEAVDPKWALNILNNLVQLLRFPNYIKTTLNCCANDNECTHDRFSDTKVIRSAKHSYLIWECMYMYRVTNRYVYKMLLQQYVYYRWVKQQLTLSDMDNMWCNCTHNVCNNKFCT